MKSFRTALLFPPVWYYPNTPAEVTYLAAYLRTKGIEPYVRDFSIEMFDFILEKDWLKDIYHRILQEWQLLNAKDNLSQQEQTRYHALAPVAITGKYVVDEVNRAKNVMRNPSCFYNYRSYRHARQVLEQACTLVSAAFAPTRITLFNYQMQYDERSFRQILQAIQATQEHPFLSILYSRWLPDILEREFDLIGLNVIHPDQIIPALTLAHVLKKEGVKAHITVFGCLEDQFNFTHVIDCLETKDASPLFSLIDSIILYECERPFTRLAEVLAAGKKPDDVPNLAYWCDGKMRVNPICEPEDIQALPAPCFKDFPFEKYFFPEKVIDYLISRSCYWGHCSFCSIGAPRRSYRCRKVNYVLDDLTSIQTQTKARFFRFRDQLLSPSYLSQFAQGVLEQGLDIIWTCRARFEPGFTTELLSTLQQAGCIAIWFGLESVSERLLNLVRKGTQRETIERILDNCGQAGIKARLLTIVGLPTETEQEARETRDFLIRHHEQIEDFSYTPFILFRQPEMAKNPAQYGITALNYPDEGMFAYRFDYATSSGMSPGEIKQVSRDVTSELKKYFPPRFLLPTHRYLYMDHYGESFTDTVLKEEETPAIEGEFLELRPRVPSQIRYGMLNYNYDFIDEQQHVGEKTPVKGNITEPLMPQEVLLVYNMETGDRWQMEKDAVFLLAASNGKTTIRAIIEQASNTFNLPMDESRQVCIDYFKEALQLKIIEFI